MRMGTILAKNHLQNLCCKRYTLPISLELLAAIRPLELYYVSENYQHSDPDISMQIYIRRGSDQYFLRIITVLERSQVEEVVESILSVMAATHKISLNTESLLKSIVV